MRSFLFYRRLFCSGGEDEEEIFMRFFYKHKGCTRERKIVSLEKSFSLIKCQTNYNVEEPEKGFFLLLAVLPLFVSINA